MAKTVKFDRLFDLIEKSLTPPKNLLAAVEGLPPVAELPSPWDTWLLIAIILHQCRQRWAKRFLKKHLPGTIPPTDRLCRQEPTSRVFRVPDILEWEVNLVGAPDVGHMTNVVNGETIFVKLTASEIDHVFDMPSLYDQWTSSPPWTPEARVRTLCPTFDTIWYALDVLDEGGMLVPLDLDFARYDGPFEPAGHRLSRRALRNMKVITAFAMQWATPDQRLWLSCVVGDWLLAEELAEASGDAQLVEIASKRAQECRQRRRRKYGGRKGDLLSFDELRVLHQLGSEDLETAVRHGLRSNSSDARRTAMWAIAQTDDPSWCPEVYWLFNIVRPGGQRPESSLAVSCASFLVKHGFHTEEVIKAVRRVKQRLGDVALLALEHAPHLALPIIRRALRRAFTGGSPSEFPDLLRQQVRSVSGNMSVVLAVLDTDWSRRELYAVLDEAQIQGAEPHKVVPFVFALEQSGNREAREYAATWQYLYEEEEYGNAQKEFECSMEFPRDRVMRLRHHTPEE